MVAPYNCLTISQRELFDTLGIDKSHVVTLIDDLSARGLIRRRSDERDGRRHQLLVTIAGRKLLPALSAQIERCQKEIFAALSPRELRHLASLLRRVLSAQRGRPSAVADTAVRTQRGHR